MKVLRIAALSFLALGCLLQVSQAAILHDQNLTSNFFAGSGISNVGFTVARDNGIELGLRARERGGEITNSLGNGTYRWAPGGDSGGDAFWNLDWSVNSNFDGSGANLSAFDYVLSMAFAPSGSSGSAFSGGADPVNGFLNGLAGNAIGNNSSPPGVSYNLLNYSSRLNDYNVAQNSRNLGFPEFALLGFDFDPDAEGTYTFTLAAYDGSTLLTSSEIQVLVETVPEPGTMTLMGMGLVGLAYGAARKRKARRSVEA